MISLSAEESIVTYMFPFFSLDNHVGITQWRPLGHFLAQKMAYILSEELCLEMLFSGMYVKKPWIIFIENLLP